MLHHSLTSQEFVCKSHHPIGTTDPTQVGRIGYADWLVTFTNEFLGFKTVMYMDILGYTPKKKYPDNRDFRSHFFTVFVDLTGLSPVPQPFRPPHFWAYHEFFCFKLTFWTIPLPYKNISKFLPWEGP